MSKKKLTYESELNNNEVHISEQIYTENKNQKSGFLRRLLGLVRINIFKAAPEEVGEWQEGDELEIIVKNKDL